MPIAKDPDIKQEELLPLISPFMTGSSIAPDIQQPWSPLSSQRQALFTLNPQAPLTPKRQALGAFHNRWASVEYRACQKVTDALKAVQNGVPDSYRIYHEAQTAREALGKRRKTEQDALYASLGIGTAEVKVSGEGIESPIAINDECTKGVPDTTISIHCSCKRLSCSTKACPCRKADQQCTVKCRLGKGHRCENKPPKLVKKEEVVAELEATKKRLRVELGLGIGPNKKVRAWMIEGGA